jgi:predicted nucleic acid-binding protein
VIFVDSNVPMYLVGTAHPNKDASRTLLERALIDREPLVTDAEVLQEIMHRYVAIDCREAIGPATDVLLDVVECVFPVEREDVERARWLVMSTPLSARDAVHVAIMQRHAVRTIMSFDRGFDAVARIERRR